LQKKIRKKIGIDVDAKPETVTEDNVAPVVEATKEEAPAVEAPAEEASKEEPKSESSSEKK